MRDPISVGLGERVVSRDPDDILVAYGLGSCLGIGMIDPVSRICGLMHAVLPVKNNGTDPFNPKFVDSGIKGLIEEMVKAGAVRNRLVIRIAGGANMLTAPGLSKTFDIGNRNIDSAYETFKELRINIKNEDVGGTRGRTVRLYVGQTRMTVRVIGEKEIDL